MSKAEQALAKYDKLDERFRKLAKERKQAKMVMENEKLKAENSKMKQEVAKAKQVLGIADAALDVFGRDLPRGREEASKVMRAAMRNGNINQNMNQVQ